MKTKIALSLIAAAYLLLGGAMFAAGAKTYHITGTVVSSTGSMVTLQKGSERFEIDVDPASVKGSADLKVGSTVTISYVMSAMKIETAAAETTPAVPASPTP
jgi:type 1 fimbria pilin